MLSKLQRTIREDDREREATGPERLVSTEALSEIRIDIHDSLEAAISLWLESGLGELIDAAALIRPAVDRLEAICRDNSFPD
jgi:hypothetical protein